MRGHRLAPALVALLAFPLPLAGQATAAQRRQVAELTARWEQARQAAEAVRRAAQQRPVDTLTVGQLRLLAQPDMTPRVAQAAELVWRRVRTVLGADSAVAASRTYFPYAGRQPEFDAARIQGVVLHPGNDVPEIAMRLATEVQRALVASLTPEQRAWLGSRFLDSLTSTELRWAYVALVTSQSPKGRECFLGSVPSCRSFLGLSTDDDIVLTRYSPRGRRALVAGRRWSLRRLVPELAAAYLDACATEEVDDACIRLLRAVPPEDLPLPAPEPMRATVVKVALELGGAGALARLRQAPGSLDDKLAAAALADLPTLLDTWRRRVVQAAPRRASLPRPTAWVALAWIVVFTLAATRSTRWRTS